MISRCLIVLALVVLFELLHTPAVADQAPAGRGTVSEPAPCAVHDPVLCYSTQAPQPRLRVTLADAFERGRYEIRTLKRFCTPASVNDATVDDPDTHLGAYHLRGPHTRRTNIRVTNQFGTFFFDTTRTETLLVPAGKTIEPAPPPTLPGPDSRVDHYRCLRAFPSGNTPRLPDNRRLKITDQFGTRLAELIHILKLCIPVDKNGEGIKNDTNILSCYEVRSTPERTATGVQIRDQFGARTIALRREYELCVPAVVDCNDENPCTLDSCAHGACTHTPAPPGTVCRPAAGACDAAELCVGTTCPIDAFAPAGTTCRPAAGDCDLEERCPGDGPLCPADRFRPSTTVCRPATDECDLPVTCSGTSATCPATDGHQPAGTPCMDDGNVCTIDQCDGTSATCQHAPGNAGAICRPSGGVCDELETCTGQSASCPADAKKPAGTVCRPAAGDCNPAETCTGTSNACPPDTLAPPGTPCDRDGELCTIDECDHKGVCHSVGNSTDPSCGFCGDTASGPCTVTVGTRTYGSLQAAIDAAKDGATITVRGVCRGPVRIDRRKALTIEGVPPTAAGCPDDGLRPTHLTSTVRGSGDNEVIKVTGSANVVIRYLNVVDGSSAGVELKDALTSTIHCNCIARNTEGVELHGGERHEVSQNLVARNHDDGIRLRSGASAARSNLVRQNRVEENGGDGVDLVNADLNQVLRNLVTGNGTTSDDSGIEVENSDQNTIDANTINGNADGLTGMIRCQSGRGNTGSNVTPACR